MCACSRKLATCCLTMVLGLAAVLAPADGPPAGSFLAGYRLAAGPLVVEQITEDLSGIACNPVTGTLLAIRNGAPRIVELSPEGKLVRVIDLDGYDDTEDLACLPDGRVVIIEERRRTLSVCALPPGPAATVKRPADVVVVDPDPAGNAGLEGVVFVPETNLLYVVKEKAPPRLYALPPPGAAGTAAAVTQPFTLAPQAFGLRDLSGLAAVPGSGNLLLLSDESRALVECTRDGREVGRLALTAGSAGLTADLVQPEGVAVDPRGRLYIVCEPDLLYLFTKP